MMVGTGLNVLGWSLARAAACLRDSSFMSEPEIASGPLPPRLLQPEAGRLPSP